MVSRPEDWVVRMKGCGHMRMLFHIEASSRAMGVVQSIRAQSVEPGIAMNPETPAAAVETLLPYIENICVMGIAPGFAGQKLIDYTYTKVAKLRAMIDRLGMPVTITVDGGVKAHNAKRLVEAGADILLLSSGIYAHSNPEESLNEVRRLVAGETLAKP